MAVNRSDILQVQGLLSAAAAAAISPAALDETWCREWLIRKIHPGGPGKCPSCSTAVSGYQVSTYYAGRRVVCKGCRTAFDARKRTILFGTSRSYSQIFCLMLLLGLGVPTKEIASRIGMSRSTIFEWKNRLPLCPLA